MGGACLINKSGNRGKDVITAVIAVTLLFFMSVPPHKKAQAVQQTGYLDDLKAGLRYIGQNKPIKALFFFYALVFFLDAQAPS